MVLHRGSQAMRQDGRLHQRHDQKGAHLAALARKVCLCRAIPGSGKGGGMGILKRYAAPIIVDKNEGEFWVS